MIDPRWVWTAQELRDYRDKRGWSLPEMASILGYSEAKCRGMEQGNAPIHPRCAWTLYLLEELRKAMKPSAYRALVRTRIAGTCAVVSTREQCQAYRHQWELTQPQMAKLLGYHWMKIAHMEQGLFPIHPRVGFQLTLLAQCRAFLPLWYRLLQMRGI